MKSGLRFTLIELLVCIAVIMILLALLLPVLSRVRHRAKVLVCMSNQRQMGLGLIMYADDNNANWPFRTGNFTALRMPGVLKNRSYCDDRPHMREYVSPDLDCTYRPRIPNRWTEDRWLIYSNYLIYAGWQLKANEKTMRKVDSTMTFNAEEFDIILAERKYEHLGKNKVDTGHPDFGRGLLWLKSPDGIFGSYWYSNLPESRYHGPIDQNYMRRDGSCFTVNNIVYDDPRLVRVRHAAHVSNSYELIPSMNFVK